LEATAQNYYNYAEQEIKNSNNNSVEREREQKPKTLKIDLTSSTSTTSWLNTPTPKNGKKFSFHSKESTEETIAEENPEDFISDLSSTELDDFEEA